MMPLTSAEIEHIATTTARKAVSETLLALGVNTADPNAVIEMQKDFASVRAWRQSVDTVRTRGLTAAVGIVVAGMLGAAWMALRGGH